MSRLDEASPPRRLIWLIGLRAVVATILLGSAALARGRGLDATWPVHPVFALAAITYVLTAAYAATLRLVSRAPWLVDVQLAIDALLVSAVVLVTGGAGSYLSSLYVLPIVAAGMVQYRRGGLLVALFELVLYSGIVLAQYTGVAGIPRGSALPPPAEALFTVALNGFGFLAVAQLTGYLAGSLRRAGQYIEHASAQIADLRALSELVVDSLVGGLAATDRLGRVLSFNRAAEAITGTSAREARGQHAAGVLQLPRELRDALDSLDESRQGRRVVYVFERVGGERIELGLTAAPLITPAGRTGWVFTFQNLTQAMKAEREAQRQKRLAAVGEMAAGIAHEIRNPLASMSGCIQILREELALTDEQASLMDIVLRESDRLNDLIRNFLAYARPQRRAAARFDVRRLLDDTAELLRHSPERLGEHRVVVDAGTSDLPFEADEAQVRQIVWNLATNGLRAMPDGGTLTLRAAAVAGAGLRLVVEDQGIGIPADQIEHIFQPFRSTFANGTGLGLPIVHRIVSDHGGEIAVESAVGVGTRFTVALPGVTAQRDAA